MIRQLFWSLSHSTGYLVYHERNNTSDVLTYKWTSFDFKSLHLNIAYSLHTKHLFVCANDNEQNLAYLPSSLLLRPIIYRLNKVVNEARDGWLLHASTASGRFYSHDADGLTLQTALWLLNMQATLVMIEKNTFHTHWVLIHVKLYFARR